MTSRRGGRRGAPAARVWVAGAALAVCGAVAPAGGAAADGGPGAYAFDPAARRIAGAATTSDARRLDLGSTYRDSLGPASTRVYRLDLDARTNAYVSVVAVPGATARVTYEDRVKVSLQNREGGDCGSNDARFGASTQFPRPIAAYADRTVEKGASSCQEAGPYFVVVERVGGESASGSADPWELEIRPVGEPLRAAPGGPTTAPTRWPSDSPAPAGAGPVARAGGGGFHDATGLTHGEWTSRIEPGASVFYRVPVDWGQQLFVSADLGSSPGQGFVGGALAVSLYNPARGLVANSAALSYDGRQKSTALDPLPPVAYENRFSSGSEEKAMRFAGWYYLRVSLNPEVGATFGAKAYGLTLRVNVEGTAAGAPRYAGPAGDFAVDQEKSDAAASGRGGAGDAGNTAMAVVAVAGIGTGTLLVLWLAGWTLLARRRAGRPH